jgi:hypothetical protein
MTEHPLAGETVTLLVDGEEEEYPMEEGISQEEGEEFINTMLGVEPADAPTEVDHPELEFAKDNSEPHTEPTKFRTLCRMEGCHETQVFDELDEVTWSRWTDVDVPVGLLTDSTELMPAYCPHHSTPGSR